jgi:hypothetical protein
MEFAIVAIVFILIIILFYWWVYRKTGHTSRPLYISQPSEYTNKQQINQIIEAAFTGKQTLTIEYATKKSGLGKSSTRGRDIKIYGLGEEYFDAYCYYRKATRTFKISRVISARLKGPKYRIPKTYEPSKWALQGWVEAEENNPEKPAIASKRTAGNRVTKANTIRSAARPTKRTNSGNKAKTSTKYNYLARFENSIHSPFPEDLSEAVPYLREAYRLDNKGGDRARINQLLARAKEIDPDATTLYKNRLAIIKKRKNHQ